MKAILFLLAFPVVIGAWPVWNLLHRSEVASQGLPNPEEKGPADAKVVYFKANGTGPVWKLEISEDQIVFVSDTAGYEYFTMPYALPVKSADGDSKTYTTQNEACEMKIDIAHVLCQLPDSRERFPYSVIVSIKTNIDTAFADFTGCGLYVPDYHLEFKWNLVSIRGEVISDTAFNDTIPFLILQASVNSFTGFSGCNTLNGRLFIEKSLLRFTDISAPKIKCPADEWEKKFVSALQFSTQYAFKADTLILSYPGREMLRLKKVPR